MAHEIIVGVAGGIAAFKTAGLVSTLVQEGWGVSVVMTAAATKFVGPDTFAALTGRPVATQVFAAHWPLGAHIELAQQAELICVAPATAHCLAQAARGLAGDLLSTLLLSFSGPILMAPAMNTEMWQKPAVARNVEQLRQDGVQLIGPQTGWLSCREVGEGRMAEPAEIQAAIEQTLAAAGKQQPDA